MNILTSFPSPSQLAQSSTQAAVPYISKSRQCNSLIPLSRTQESNILTQMTHNSPVHLILLQPFQPHPDTQTIHKLVKPQDPQTRQSHPQRVRRPPPNRLSKPTKLEGNCSARPRSLNTTNRRSHSTRPVISWCGLRDSWVLGHDHSRAFRTRSGKPDLEGVLASNNFVIGIPGNWQSLRL